MTAAVLSSAIEETISIRFTWVPETYEKCHESAAILII
jgi:hypothetical protein